MKQLKTGSPLVSRSFFSMKTHMADGEGETTEESLTAKEKGGAASFVTVYPPTAFNCALT